MDMFTTKYTRGILVDEGKTKEVHQVGNDPDLVRITSKDDITADDGAKHDVIKKKGQFSNETTCNVFRYLLKHKIPVAFQEQVDAVSFVAPKCSMLPFEVVVRREAHGSYLKRYPQLEKGHLFQKPLVEFFLKTKNKRWKTYELVCDDPLISYSKHTGEVRLFDPSKPMQCQEAFLTFPMMKVIGDREESNNYLEMSRIALQAFRTLEKAWGLRGGKLVDYKVEFGFTNDNRLLLADVIDNDSWRVVKNGAYIDKQVYRDDGTLEEVIANYQQVAAITKRFMQPARSKYQRRCTMPNLVQAEFFHVGGEEAEASGGLEGILKECKERIGENFELAQTGVEVTSGIKTVVRFFDESGIVTASALQASDLHTRKNKTYEQYFIAKNFFSRTLLEMKIAHLRRLNSRVKRNYTKTVLESLSAAIFDSKMIAIEKMDHSFRLARKNELHEILNRAYRSRDLWLFVFEPNLLLADENKGIVSIM